MVYKNKAVVLMEEDSQALRIEQGVFSADLRRAESYRGIQNQSHRIASPGIMLNVSENRLG